MFCPQCGNQQPSSDMRFCSRCGLSLGLATDLLPSTSIQLQREKRELTGVGLMMATVLMLVNFLLVFGLITLPHLANPVFLWIWLSFLISSLVAGGFGVANLIRAGFFTRLKERESRLRLMKTEQDRQITPPSAGSITEMTTRNLEVIPKSDKREHLT